METEKRYFIIYYVAMIVRTDNSMETVQGWIPYINVFYPNANKVESILKADLGVSAVAITNVSELNIADLEEFLYNGQFDITEVEKIFNDSWERIKDTEGD